MKKFLIFTSDAFILYASLVATVWVRYPKDFERQYWIHLYPFGLIFVLWLLVFYIANLYEPKLLRNNLRFYSTLFQAITISGIISVLFFYLIPLYGITPKTNLLLFAGIFFGLEFLSRFTSNNIIQKGFKKSVLIVGTNNQSLELNLYLKENPQIGYEIKSIIDLSSDKIQEINKIIAEEKIDTIILSPEAYKIPKIINIFYKSLEQKVSFMNLASFYEHVTGMVPLEAIGQIWFLENLNEGNKRAYEMMKRVSDLIFAFLIGIVSLLFYPLIFILIKTTSPGPIFYRQKRIGQAGKIFKIIKFRTMSQDAEKTTGAVWAISDDPRITKIGKFMRRARLDELPQIWNILKGEMSFIGPRPERPSFVEKLREKIPFYDLRVCVRPGITGWAQIRYPYGASEEDALEKLKYDLYYIKNWSFFFDILILFETIKVVLFGKGGR